MPKEISFTDENDNKLTFYPNDKNQLFINIHYPDDEMGGNYICLNQNDTAEFIKCLQEFVEYLD